MRSNESEEELFLKAKAFAEKVANDIAGSRLFMGINVLDITLDDMTRQLKSLLAKK